MPKTLPCAQDKAPTSSRRSPLPSPGAPRHHFIFALFSSLKYKSHLLLQFFFSLPKHGLNQLFARYGPGASLIRPQWKPRDTTSTPSSPSTDSEGFDAVTQTLKDEQQLQHSSSEDETTARHHAAEVDGISSRLQRAKLDMVPQQVKFGNRKGPKAFSKS